MHIQKKYVSEPMIYLDSIKKEKPLTTPPVPASPFIHLGKALRTDIGIDRSIDMAMDRHKKQKESMF